MKRILITGDSLSYNRYDYDDTPRLNAWDCYIGMQSWSFRLRNYFITSAPGFCYGDEIEFDTKTTKEIESDNAIFGERVVTAIPENGEIRFKVQSDSGKVALYLQAHPEQYCRFNIYADGIKVAENIDTFGSPYSFMGYSLITFEFACDKDKTYHDIVFSDFEKCEKSPMVTIAGASTQAVYADLSGQGSRTCEFLLYHFEERIAKYSPELLILIFGGNDFLFFNKDEYRENLDKLFGKVKTRFPECRILTLTTPPGKPSERFGDCKTDEEFNIRYTDNFNSVMKEITGKYNGKCIDTKEIFKSTPKSVWRYDNIHMTREGNNILYDYMKHLFDKHTNV